MPGLSALEKALRDRGSKAFAKAQDSWLGDKSAGFFQSADRVGQAIGSETSRDQEIERKFLLNGLPAFDRPDSVAEIEQGYLPGKKLIERIRRVRSEGREEFLRTIKEGTGMTRLEVEEPVPAELFDQLWPLTEGRRLRKHRHKVKDGKLTWEIDEFQDRDLVLAEVELDSPSAEVTVPDWLRPHLVREVTDDSRYSNYPAGLRFGEGRGEPRAIESPARVPGRSPQPALPGALPRSGEIHPDPAQVRTPA